MADPGAQAVRELTDLAALALDDRAWLFSRVADLEADLRVVRRSTSWRFTWPLRLAGRLVVRLRLLAAILRYVRQTYSDSAHLARLARQLRNAWQDEGLAGLRAVAVFYYLQRTLAAPPAAPLPQAERLPLAGTAAPAAALDVAVHVHAFHVDLLPELFSYLRNIPQEVTLYVSTDAAEKAERIRQAIRQAERIKAATVLVVENRGRDVAPFLVTLGERLAAHGLVLHLHTKKSPHNPDLRGWRRYLLDSLVGSPEIAAAILARFAVDPTLGLFYPTGFYPVRPLMRVGGNLVWMTRLIRRAGRPMSDMEQVDTTEFPAGSMFWCRGEALRGLLDLALTTEDFEAEAGQVDGTLAHAIERLLPYFARRAGLQSRAYLPDNLYHPAAPGALRLAPGTLAAIRRAHAGQQIIFDHTAGGGTQLYRQRLTDELLGRDHAVVRAYNGGPAGTWLIDLATRGGTDTFAVDDIDALFGALAECESATIVVNSLYGFPQVDQVIARILALAQATHSAIEVKIHDFHALCPSPHLMDARARYCGLPTDTRVCDRCLVRNPSAAWTSTDVPSIAAWRVPFAKLLAAAATVTAFDPSSIAMLRRVYDLPDARVRITPHSDAYFSAVDPVPLRGPLHIGVFGTLTPAKGASIVYDLAEWIRTSGDDASVTVVGQSVTATHPTVTVTGRYDVDALPAIVRRSGINVGLLASIVPETFSYTLTEMMKLGLPVVAFDLGAQGRRTAAYPLGRVVPLDSTPAAILQAARDVLDSALARQSAA